MLLLKLLFINITNSLNYKYMFILPFIFRTLHKEIPEDAEPFIMYSFNMGMLALLCLVLLTNVLGYVISLYVIERFQLNLKYPKLQKVITFYSKTTVTFIILESIFCFLLLLFIVIYNFYMCGLILSKV